MKFYDISVTITPDLPVWPGDPRIELARVGKIEDGANANVSQLTLGVHTGTHVDAPYHFLPAGTRVDAMPLDVLIGPAVVVQIPDEVKEIGREALQAARIPAGTRRLLLKTFNSTFWPPKTTDFNTGFVGIDREGAEYLVEIGIQLVGIDYLSISPYKNSRPTHEVLLGAKMVVLEGAVLAHVEPGAYQLYCLPLKLGGADGAPTRAVLVAED